MKTTQPSKQKPKMGIRPISLQDLLKKTSVDTLKDSHVCFGMLSHMKIDHDICTGKQGAQTLFIARLCMNKHTYPRSYMP
jgi:hypothetical protein